MQISTEPASCTRRDSDLTAIANNKTQTKWWYKEGKRTETQCRHLLQGSAQKHKRFQRQLTFQRVDYHLDLRLLHGKLHILRHLRAFLRWGRCTRTAIDFAPLRRRAICLLRRFCHLRLDDLHLLSNNGGIPPRSQVHKREANKQTIRRNGATPFPRPDS